MTVCDNLAACQKYLSSDDLISCYKMKLSKFSCELWALLCFLLNITSVLSDGNGKWVFDLNTVSIFIHSLFITPLYLPVSYLFLLYVSRSINCGSEVCFNPFLKHVYVFVTYVFPFIILHVIFFSPLDMLLFQRACSKALKSSFLVS